MAIPDFVAGDEASAAHLNRVVDVVTPRWWKGVLSSSKSTTTGRYVSLTFASDGTGEGLSVTATSDSVSPGVDGVYEVAIRAWHSSIDSTAKRMLMVILNPSANTVDSTTNVTGTIVAHMDQDSEADASPSMIVHEPRIRLTTTDKLLVVTYQNSGSTLSMSSLPERTAFSLVYIGE